jgi:SAM-dependent methyltransferase
VPLRDNASGLTLAMHMLYHVPESLAAIRELRRITHPAGQVLVVLNGEDHLRELRDLITAALGNLTHAEPPLRERLRLDDGEGMLASEFTSITRHDFTGELLIPGPQPAAVRYQSMWRGSRAGVVDDWLAAQYQSGSLRRFSGYG